MGQGGSADPPCPDLWDTVPPRRGPPHRAWRVCIPSPPLFPLIRGYFDSGSPGGSAFRLAVSSRWYTGLHFRRGMNRVEEQPGRSPRGGRRPTNNDTAESRNAMERQRVRLRQLRGGGGGMLPRRDLGALDDHMQSSAEGARAAGSERSRRGSILPPPAQLRNGRISETVSRSAGG